LEFPIFTPTSALVIRCNDKEYLPFNMELLSCVDKEERGAAAYFSAPAAHTPG
jgi:hypothetical protein